VLRLGANAIVDVNVVFKGAWADAVRLPGLGADLLEGMAIKGAAAFETWLLSQQRHVAAASEAILHEAALGSMSRGALDAAIGYAVRAASMSPLDENHQALLIRLYRMAGDDEAAARQLDAWAKTSAEEFGVAPGPAVQAAMREPRSAPEAMAGDATIEALVEAGAAAVSAGAVEAGVRSLLTAAQLADRAGSIRLRVGARLVLAEALVHGLGGLDEAGLAALYEADEIALAHELSDAVAQARAELGYVDFLRGRYDRAEFWLTNALSFADGSRAVTAKAMTYLGAVESDRANYGRAAELLEQAITLSQASGECRREAYGRAMLGRISFLCGALDAARRIRPRTCPGGRGRGRRRSRLRAAVRCPVSRPAPGRALSLARWLHPRCPVPARLATRPSGHTGLGGDDAEASSPHRDAGTRAAVATPRRRPRQ
jgi:tetratricopeptide (TPR) repeat protein